MHQRYRQFDVTWVAIDGGPGGGKSTGLSVMRQRLEDAGFRVVTIEESATKIIGRGFSPFAKWKDPDAFQRHVLRSITNAESEAYQAALDLVPPKHTVILCDRGAPSGMAYIGQEAFEEVARQEGYSLLELYDRYAIAIFLVTAADGAEEHYTTANNSARSEQDPAVAREVDRKTQLAWHGHRRLRVIDNSTGFDEKIRRAVNELARVLNMPEAHERERKFVILNFRPELIPPTAVKVIITQDYLASDDPELGRRVRQRELGGSKTYFYTEKRETGIAGDRLEKEPQITEAKYKRYLRQRQAGLETIRKERRVSIYKSRSLEFDNFLNPSYLGWLALLEVEVGDLSEHIEFPPELELLEVTHDKRFSNYELAKGSLRGWTLDDVLRNMTAA